MTADLRRSPADGPSETAARPQVRVTIDRLVLRGVPARQRDALVAALHAELRRGLGRAGGAELGPGRSVAALPAGRVRARAGAGPATVGAAAARHIVRALHGHGSRGGAP